MNDVVVRVLDWLRPCLCDACFDARMSAAFADCSVADHTEPVAAEAVVPLTEPHGHDLDAVSHE